MIVSSQKQVPPNFTGKIFIQDTTCYYLNGNFHREKGPSIINLQKKSKYYYYHGKLHRENGPAISFPEYKAYYNNGVAHNLKGPALITKYSKTWIVNGKKHREDGPAVIFNGKYEWWFNDELIGEGKQFTYKSWKKYVGMRVFI